MSKTQTKIDAVVDDLRGVASNAAIVTMAAATILGMTELTDRQDLKVMAQPAYAYAGDNLAQPIQDNSMRKEEVAHNPVSYGTLMRSEAISGKR